MNGCKHCNASVSSLFTEVDAEGLSVYLDNKPDGSILALGYIRNSRPCLSNYVLLSTVN